MDEGLLNDLLECSVCLERLDTSSRVLPCQHTFCLKCLKVIVESHKELRCPECRILVEAKVEELPPNVLLMRILEGMKNAPRKPAGSGHRVKAGHQLVHLQGAQQTARGEGKQLPPHARALYDYISKEQGDLSFKKGETILLQKKLDPFWYQGECSGRTGMFPITYVQVMVPLQATTALCKALYDFRMSAPDEEGCLAFDKGAIITVHRRVDENWAEGRLDQRVGIFPIAFVELNQPARQLMNSTPLNRPVPPLPDHARAGHSDHRHHTQHPHRYQQMSMSTPAAAGNYQNMPPMSQSHPHYHTQMMTPQSQVMVQQSVGGGGGGVVAAVGAAGRLAEPALAKHSFDITHFINVHNKQQAQDCSLQVSRIAQDFMDRHRGLKFESFNSAGVHKVETAYQNVRLQDAAATLGSDSSSSSSMNTASLGLSSASPVSPQPQDSPHPLDPAPNPHAPPSTSPSLPSSPDDAVPALAHQPPQLAHLVQPNDDDANDQQESSLNTSMGVLSLNESSTATNTSLNVSLPPSESPKLNNSNASTSSQNHCEAQESANQSEPRLDAPSSSKNLHRSSGPDSLLNFGIGLQAALSPSHGKEGNYMVRGHRDHTREKRHSLTPSSHLQGGHSTQNRHSAEILATSLLDHVPERDRERPERERERERRRRRSRSNERPLPAAYIALYPYKPQKPDELELKKGGVYTVTERCRDGWYKGMGLGLRCGVFPGNYVAPAPHPAPHVAPPARPKLAHDKSGNVQVCGSVGKAGAASALPPPDAPPRAASPNTTAQPLTYPWSSPSQTQPQSTPRSEKSKDKSKAEKSSISSGVSLMKRLAAMKKCKSPPPVGYSMDNPVFDDGPGTSLMLNLPVQHHPVHVRSGSCPSQLLRTLPPPAADRARHKDRPALLCVRDHHSTTSEGPWQSQHRKSQSLDVTAVRRDRHHSQNVKERFRCIVPYPPNSEYELELKVDDIVVVSRKRGDGWYKGTLQRTGRTGLFPASFVQSCPAPASHQE